MTKDIERFWNKVKEHPKTGCLEWTGSTVGGYGVLRRKGKVHYAHRYVMGIEGRQFSEHLCIRHSCDNRRCVNPEHLTPGTHLENMSDMVLRNRAFQGKGSLNGNAILSENEIDTILSMLENGESQGSISTRFKVSQSTISRISRKPLGYYNHCTG